MDVQFPEKLSQSLVLMGMGRWLTCVLSVTYMTVPVEVSESFQPRHYVPRISPEPRLYSVEFDTRPEVEQGLLSVAVQCGKLSPQGIFESSRWRPGYGPAL